MRNVSSAEKTRSLVDESMETSLGNGRYNPCSLRSRLCWVITRISQCEIARSCIWLVRKPSEFETSIVARSYGARPDSLPATALISDL